MSTNVDLNNRPDYDHVIQDITDYVLDYTIHSTEALDTARYGLMDAMGCALLALRFPECTKHLGPLVEGTIVPHGARVPGTSFRLDPVKACDGLVSKSREAAHPLAGLERLAILVSKTLDHASGLGNVSCNVKRYIIDLYP